MSTSATVLVVDDNRELAENVCEVLEVVDEIQLNCLIAASRRDALNVCTNHVEDLHAALIDLHLPDGHGIQLASEIRALCPFAQIIIITGDATLESAMAAIGEGAFAYVLKPFRGDDLLQTTRRAVAQAALLKEREQLRRELERSERHHREVVEAIPALVIGLDEQDRIALWNRRLEEITGFDRSEMFGKPGQALVGAGGDRKLPLKGGGHRLVRWQRADLPTPQGPALKYALGMDVTDEREMLRRTLRAERLAAVGTLAAGLAHEVRNPLNSATLQLQVLRRRVQRGETGAEAVLPILGIVSDEIKRLDRLVSDFLSFAQPRPLALVPTELNPLLETTIELIRPEAAAAGVEVRCVLAANVGTIELEPERLRQVLLNLTRNAIEALGHGGRLIVRSHAADDQGNVGIEIEDDGPGFPDEAPIFDAFYTTKDGGTGLGLAIAHRIVTEHGGTIRAESRPGCTRFTLYLPQLRV